MKTLLLDQRTWDLCVDLDGNIAVASEPYAQAQDAASALKTFQGECYYNTARGLPYWASILGQAPPLSLLRSYFTQAALTVPGVTQARCFFTRFSERRLQGQVQIKNTVGQVSATDF